MCSSDLRRPQGMWYRGWPWRSAHRSKPFCGARSGRQRAPDRPDHHAQVGGGGWGAAVLSMRRALLRACDGAHGARGMRAPPACAAGFPAVLLLQGVERGGWVRKGRGG